MSRVIAAAMALSSVSVIAIAAVSIIALVAFFATVRQPANPGDGYAVSEIDDPHHAGAILMCEEAPIEDAEIKALCASIVEGQRSKPCWIAPQTRPERKESTP
ncbi:MAG: hypothetical protein H7X89_13450 [Rhizobiales bacterium]|nr:hypothetical protein [Hyphomicrobiales bacterium]